jgi:hypothetical protein
MKGNHFGLLDTGDEVETDYQTVDSKLKKGMNHSKSR